ncbi:acetate--CoA ligase family protein [Streptomyces sp. NPDC055400]
MQAELTQDLALELAPCSHGTAREMIRGLRSWPLLSGWRGKRPVDVDALAAVVVAVSELIADRGDIGEIELNPVRVSPEGALAVDALVIAAPAPGNPSTP